MRNASPSGVHHRVISQNRWIPPLAGSVKLNTDGAFSCSGSRSAAAAICRDGDGNFIGGSALVIDGLNDPEIVEALACREALNLAADLGLANLHIASDCKEVFDDLRGDSLGRFGPIIREIAGRATGFDSCSFHHELRSSNFEAHNLAKFSSSLGVGRHVWLGTPYDVISVPMNILHE